jgi:hypothetical protein
VKRVLVQVWTIVLLDVGLVKIFKGEYASTIIMTIYIYIYIYMSIELNVTCVGIIIRWTMRPI